MSRDMTYLEVTLSNLKGTVVVGIFDGASSLRGNRVGMASVLLGKVEESVNGLLVILVTLNLNNHLLQAPDSLVTTLLRHLLIEVVLGILLGGISSPAGPLLGLVVDVVGGLVLETLETLRGTGGSINAGVRGSTLLLLLASSKISGITGVTGAAWVSSLSRITGSILHVLSREWLVLVDNVLGLRLELTNGWNIVPGVVLGRVVDAVESLPVRVDLLGSLLGSITGNVTQEYGSVAD
jgi:hypothetical protein